MLNLGETFPNFVAPSTQGLLDIYAHLGNSWGVIFSHPADYTPVCTTEIARMAQLFKQFEQRNVKPIVLSIDTVDDHKAWVEDVQKVSGCEVKFPLVGDETGNIAESIGMLDKSQDKRVTVRGVFVIDPEKKVKATICYPTSTGRNFDEIIRLIDSLQLTTLRPEVVTPVDWQVGGELIVKPGCEIEGCTTVQLPSGKGYLRYVKQ